jgi:hypothetical protein
MAYPLSGDTGVQGMVAWVTNVPGLGIWVGAVLAFASIYGDYPAYAEGPNPLLFTFESSSEITAGQVTFDVAAGNFANYATNVTNV